jgi:hypothetical protein
MDIPKDLRDWAMGQAFRIFGWGGDFDQELWNVFYVAKQARLQGESNIHREEELFILVCIRLRISETVLLVPAAE